MKVGTDGVLLGAWASVADVPAEDAARPLSPLYLLDIGTGTGLVALMLAQRAASGVWGRRPFAVTAVERDAAAAAQAQENVSASPWASMVTVVTADIRTWRPPAPEAGDSAPPFAFDLIACNPPFFSDSLKGPDAARNAARHDDTLPQDSLFRLAAAWLKPAPAALNLILPADRERSAVETAARHGLRLARLCHVFTAPRATSPSRVLLTFVRTDGLPLVGSPLVGSPLVEQLRIYRPALSTATFPSPVSSKAQPVAETPDAMARHTAVTPPYSEAFRALVRPFYLNM